VTCRMFSTRRSGEPRNGFPEMAVDSSTPMLPNNRLKDSAVYCVCVGTETSEVRPKV